MTDQAKSPDTVTPFELYGDSTHFHDGVKREFVEVKDLTSDYVTANPDKKVWMRVRVHSSRCKGKLGFITMRSEGKTVQGVLDAKRVGDLGKDMVKFAGSIPLESIIDIECTPLAAFKPVTSCTQSDVEVQINRLYCISRALEQLPFYLKDANTPEHQEKEGDIRVELPTRLDNRVLDLRTDVSRAIFKVQSEVCYLFREFLRGKGFMEIHSPKLIGGASEGGANVFNLEYFKQPACLAQSPQLYKQMAISSDFNKVFEIGPVFRAENSNTHRHLCEFTGLDMEMAFKEDYTEALDVMGEMFNYIFKGLSEGCAAEQKVVNDFFGVEPFKWNEEVLRIPYDEGMKMLREDGCSEIPEDTSEYDMGTEEEKRLGRLVKAKYGTDFYMLIDFPLAVRPFYTHAHPTKAGYSNSYDFFMRGEEIVSGAQRIHLADELETSAKSKGIDVETIRPYIDSFRLGCYPHAGCGVGLERVVMLFLGSGNIRRSSLFPRDPKRLAP